MKTPNALVREDVHGMTVMRRAALAFAFFMMFLATSGFWPWFLELYGYTLKGQHFASRFFVLAALLACMGYLHVKHRINFERFCIAYFMYLGIFGGLTLLLPYRDDSMDFFVAGEKASSQFFQNLIDLIPADCMPHIDLNGVLQSNCPAQSVNILWFFVLGLPYAILGINGLSADFFTGATILYEDRSPQLGLFFMLKAVPFLFVFFVGLQALWAQSPYSAARWGAIIVFLFFYHGYMGGGVLSF